MKTRSQFYSSFWKHTQNKRRI